MSNRPPAFTAERLLNILRSLPPVNSYYIGFSGGADSTALLYALHELRNRLDTSFTAVHVNHGLHERADSWQSECEVFCRKHDIELICLAIQPRKNSGKGLEAEARQLRYEAISALLDSGDCLLTAHHADDQAETLLLNLMRGSGVDGLSSMPESRPLGNGLLQRPLLGFQGSTLRDYLHSNHIEWSEDPSNQHTDHDRNFVRHELIPLLETRWPGVSKRLLLTRKAMTDARRLLETVANDYLDENLLHPGILKVVPGSLKDMELIKLAVRQWIRRSGAPSIPSYQLESFCQQLSQPSRNHKVAIRWAGWTIRQYRQQLWLCEEQDVQPCPTVNWPDTETGLDLGSECGHIFLDGDTPNIPIGKFSVTCRADTDLGNLFHGGHHKDLKKLFQDAEIPPWLRDCIPLCTLDGELVALGDWCIDDHFSAWLKNRKTHLRWQPEQTLLKYIQTQQNTGTVDPAGVLS